MTFESDNVDGTVGNLRKQKREQEDKKRMAYRRAIEQYQESKALQAQVCDFPEWAATAQDHPRLH